MSKSTASRFKEQVGKFVYISGPMTGIEDHNFPAFNGAAQYLRDLGFIVFNPAENDGGNTNHSFEDYMRMDISQVINSDMVVVLKGWEDSPGARLEVLVAKSLGKPVFLFPNLEIMMFDVTTGIDR